MSTENTGNRNEAIGAAWRYVGKNDLHYYKGYITVGNEKVQIIMFKNKYKQAGSKQPDWNIYKSVPKPKPDADTTTTAKPVQKAATAPRTQSKIPVPSLPKAPVPEENQTL